MWMGHVAQHVVDVPVFVDDQAVTFGYLDSVSIKAWGNIKTTINEALSN